MGKPSKTSTGAARREPEAAPRRRLSVRSAIGTFRTCHLHRRMSGGKADMARTGRSVGNDPKQTLALETEPLATPRVRAPLVRSPPHEIGKSPELHCHRSSGAKRTSLIGWPMSANDPKRTIEVQAKSSREAPWRACQSQRRDPLTLFDPF
jgi:hypothetical protein